MNKFNPSEIGKDVKSEVACFVYRVPKENLDKMMNLNREFTEIIEKFGAKHLIFQLSNKESPMEGIANISKTLLAGQNDEVLMELILYRDRDHRSEVDARMKNDERMGPMFQQALELITPGTSFTMGEFSQL